MGKIDLAFDHIKDNKEIQELSVVLYTDSFFYGLWGADNYLIKTGYHPLSNLDALQKIWSYYYSFDNVKVLSALKPFVHLAVDHFDQQYFDVYFQGLYNTERLSVHFPKHETFKAFDIKTLHYLEEKTIVQFEDFNQAYTTAHISTAMANYVSKSACDLICHLANNILHVSYLDRTGFRYYNQFYCHYESDYLYFLLMVFQSYDLDRQTHEVKIGGDISEGSDLYNQLSKQLGNISLLPDTIQFRSPVTAANNYCDLYLCKTCV